MGAPTTPAGPCTGALRRKLPTGHPSVADRQGTSPFQVLDTQGPLGGSRRPGPVNGADLCRMFNAAIQGRGAPRHLSTDHDPLFEAHRWTANLRILEIDEVKTVPHVPRSHPFVERLIGTTRRECLDHVLFWNARDLEPKFGDFQAYDNEVRSHASLKGYTPSTFVGGHMVARTELNNVRWVSHCRDLVQLPVAA